MFSQEVFLLKVYQSGEKKPIEGGTCVWKNLFFFFFLITERPLSFHLNEVSITLMQVHVNEALLMTGWPQVISP